MQEYVEKSIQLENGKFCLEIGRDCVARSLVHKATGQECLEAEAQMALFSLTEERPYNNEIKLAHPNKRTTFQANRVRLEGDRLIVGFELVTFEAVVEVRIAPAYMAFQLVDFIIKPEDFGHLALTPPPVYEFRMLQLPVKDREHFGEWLNVSWDEQVAVNVLGTSPYTRIEADARRGYRIMSADALRDVKLKGCGAALIAAAREEFLDAVEAVEVDFDLPRGVASRRGDRINASIYWTANVNPGNVEECIAYARQGGFRMMLINYCAMFKESGWYDHCGDYDFREEYPEGIEDLKRMLRRIKEAGITPGFHFLHPHIGVKSRYVTPVADHRLHLTKYFTLARPLEPDADTVYVEEDPTGTVMEPRCRVLKFGGELISYESYTTERPYCFTGCKRGHFDTQVRSHEMGTIGGILDISAYGADSVYIDQKSGLQDEIGDKLAGIYDAGFEFVYFDGSEGTNAPYEIYIPLAQHRVYQKLGKAPAFCEGAAKAHFSWHMLSGGNAFDVFRPEEFKQKLVEHPFKEAPRMARDFTRLNFGWWRYFQETQPDQFEFGTSRAAAWDCPVTMMENVEVFRSNPRTGDNLEVMRRWEDVRAKGLLTPEMKQQLKNPDQEHILLINEQGEYELVPYDCVSGAAGGNPELSAYVFERAGRSWAVYWHTTGCRELTIPVSDRQICCYDEIGGAPVAIRQTGKETVVPAEGRRYLSTTLSREQLVAALEKAYFYNC